MLIANVGSALVFDVESRTYVKKSDSIFVKQNSYLVIYDGAILQMGNSANGSRGELIL